MRVVYDHQIFSAQRYGGVSRYFVELAGRMAERNDCSVGILAFAHINAHLRGVPSNYVRGIRIPRLPHTDRLRQHVDDALTRVALRFDHPDILHETYYSAVSLSPTGVPTVVTVYDMIHERFPQYFSNAGTITHRKREAVARAAHVICISESTRQDLLERFPVDPSRVSVVYLASSVRCPPNATNTRMKQEARYLLFVGHRGGYKNFVTLLRALPQIPAHLQPIRLILFGGGPLTLSERGEMALLGISETLVSHCEGDDTLLANLYANAAAFVYPSLYEGFGIPVLEAMSCGCPVICGNTSSLLELASGAAELCDTSSAAELAAAITSVIGSSKRSDELRELGANRCVSFSWDRCANETYEIYKVAQE